MVTLGGEAARQSTRVTGPWCGEGGDTGLQQDSRTSHLVWVEGEKIPWD